MTNTRLREAMAKGAAELRALHYRAHPNCPDSGPDTCPTWEAIYALEHNCPEPCWCDQCPLCCFRPYEDRATRAEHSRACRINNGHMEFTSNPGCSNRDYHHNGTWCDVCKGVA